MSNTILCSTLAAVVLAMGCSGSESVGRAGEDEPAAPATNELIVTTAGGARLTGRAVRIVIERPDADKPPVHIELQVSAEDRTGTLVFVQAATDVQFLNSGTLSAVLSSEGGPQQPGRARLLVGHKGATASPQAATNGRLQVSLVDGRLRGEVTGAGPSFDLEFAGPISVDCSTLLPVANAPVSQEPGYGPGLTLDPKFESPACKPYASWGGSGP